MTCCSHRLCGAWCRRTNFHLKMGASIVARLDRKEMDEDDAFPLALLLVSLYPGQVIVPACGPRPRPFRRALIRQNRLAVVDARRTRRQDAADGAAHGGQDG